MTKDSAALAAAENIDQGVGGVAPIYISVPLKEGIPNIGDADFETVKTAHAVVEKHLGQNKVVSAASYKFYENSGFSRETILNAVGELRSRFVTPDGTQALVTGFMPTIISSTEIEDLVEAIGIAADQAHRALALDLQRHALVRGLALERGHDPADQPDRVVRAGVDGQPSGLQAGQIEEVVDHPVHAQAVALDHVEHPLHGCGNPRRRDRTGRLNR